MKKFCLLVLTVALLALLAACGGSAEPESSPAPPPVPQFAAEPVPMAPAVQQGWASPEFMEEGAKKVSANPAAFGEFFAAYMQENAASIVMPTLFSSSNVGHLFKAEVSGSTLPAGQNKILVYYHQLPNSEAGIEENSGIFLDCMAQLPSEQIPESLLACDRVITLMITPETAFTYENDMPGIRWTIEVLCTDLQTGEFISETFDGGAPPYMAMYLAGAKYIDGGFPLHQAVEYALLLAATEPGAPLPAPPEPAPYMIVSSPGEIDGKIADEYALAGQQQENGVPTRSLPLVIENAPEDTVCFALIMLDDNANGFVHWLAANFTATELPANASIDNAADMVQGINDFGRLGYGGPAPPDKSLHNYSIIVYALDAELPLSNGFSEDELNKVFYEHVLDQSTLNIMYFD